MELIKSDLEMTMAVFDMLDLVAGIIGVHDATITVTNEAGDEITVGYGESGDPAILAVRTESEKPKIQFTEPTKISYPYTINNNDLYGGDLSDGGKIATFEPRRKP